MEKSFKIGDMVRLKSDFANTSSNPILIMTVGDNYDKDQVTCYYKSRDEDGFSKIVKQNLPIAILEIVK